MNRLWVGWILTAPLAAAPALHAVDVCVEGPLVQERILNKALWVARGVYREIAVDVRWRCSANPGERDVQIGFVESHNSRLSKHAVAYALPYEGRTIRIFLDRIRRYPEATRGNMLGYIIAHEMGHLLQGIARHSENGLMKPDWDDHDRYLMWLRKLKFTEVDVELIHRGLGERQSAAVRRVTKP